MTVDRSTRAGEGWVNQIVRYAEEAPDQLLANPFNARIHPRQQQLALTGVLDEVGWIAPVICNEVTNHVIDGHLRIALAISKGQSTVPVAYVRLTPEAEKLALATYDPLSAMAVTDADQLSALLAEVSTEDGAVADLLAGLAEDASAVAGMGETAGGPLVKSARTVAAVIAVDDVAVVERALRATGVRNRGEAMVTICRTFLGEPV